MDRQLIGGEDNLLWLLGGDLKGETGSEIMAAQVKALQTKYHSTKILQTETDSKCRKKQYDEKVERIILACPILAKEQYIQRHDTVCVELRCDICKEIGGKLYNKELYDHVTKLEKQVVNLRSLYNRTKSANRKNCF